MSSKVALTIVILLLSACASPRPAPERPAPPDIPEMEPELPADPAAIDAAAEALDALRTATAEPDFHPETALALLLPLPTAELERLRATHQRENRLAPWLDLAADIRPHLLDDARLGTALTEWANRHPRAGYYPRDAIEWIRAWREVIDWPTHIVVLLPGSGPLLQAGVALRDGMVAQWLTLPAAQRPTLEFIELDARAEAAAGARFEAQARGADFIIGPLDRQQVDALLALPGASIPVLLLNQPADSTLLEDDPGLHFVLALPPEEEAELAAAHALAVGHRGAIVLEQNTAWGARVGDAFSGYFEAGGGQVVERRRFDRNESDHSALLESVLGFEVSATRARALQSTLGRQVNFEPIMRSDADFLFFAGRGQDVRIIKPQLAYVGAGELPVYGTSQLHEGLSRAGASGDLNGLEFPLAPWFVPGLPQGETGRRAQDQYANLSNPTLSQLHALGRDAIGLVPWLEFMSDDEKLYLPGMTGRLYLTDGRRVGRHLPWVKLQGNVLRLVTDSTGP